MAAVDVDFDLLVKRIENTIVEDQLRYRPGFTPQELLSRSNTAMFSLEVSGQHQDLTNPREMYSLLSNRSKSIDDLTEKFKRGLVTSIQTHGSLQNLTRAVSLNDVYKHSVKEYNKRTRVNKQQHAGKHMSNEYENVTKWNLPRIAHHTISREDTEHGRSRHKAGDTQLPSLREVRYGREHEHAKIHSNDAPIGVYKIRTEKSGQHTDPKLDKWFSEMPNEVFDRAKRALMRQQIKDKVQIRDSSHFKSTFPNPLNSSTRNSRKRVHNTFLELRVDSFGKHLEVENEDKLNRYKLKQKSMHQLKMREKSDADETERHFREDSKLGIEYRSLTNLGLTKPKLKCATDTTNQKPRRDAANIHTAHNYKVLYINDKLAVEPRDRHWTSNYEDYTERVAITHKLHEHDHFIGTLKVPANEDIHHYAERTFPLIRENTKASVVTLALEKDIPKPRKPKHIERSIKEAKPSRDVKTESDKTVKRTDEEKHKAKDSPEKNSIRPNPIVTKIPTGQSSRTSESKSTSSSISKTNMEALKKFNTLEVFAESSVVNESVYSKSNVKHNQHRCVDYAQSLPGTSFQFPVKFDLRQQQQQQRRPVRLPVPDLLQLHELKKPESDIIFRFEPGEVFVEHKPQRYYTNQNKPSDRAKLIYGKTPHLFGDFKTHFKTLVQKEDTKDSHSLTTLSTKLDAYREELGRFESRAVDDSVKSLSSRQEEGAQEPVLLIKSHTFHETSDRFKAKRTYVKQRTKENTPKCDVATATEVQVDSRDLGEGTDTRTPASNQSVISSMTNRSGSTLSDFIVDNNDGETLDSDSVGGLQSQILRIRSSQSV